MNRLRRLPRPPRLHLPEEINVFRPEEALEWGRNLLAIPLDSPDRLAGWLAARAEFEAAMDEALLLARLDFADLPADPYRRSWLDGLHRQSGAQLEELRHRLDRHLAGAVEGGPVEAGSSWLPGLHARLGLYRESNLALKERLTELEIDYTEMLGGLIVERTGQPCPLSEIRHLLQGADPTIRRAVWEARAARLEELRPAFEDLLDETLALREQIARNADCPTWNAYRVACGWPPQAWRPEELLAAAADQARVTRPWDLGASGPGCASCPAGAERLLAELTDGLSYHAPALSQTLRRLELSHLLDLQPRPGKFDLDACFWLPERRLPVLRLSAHALEDDLCRFLRHLLAAQHGLTECAAGRPPIGTLLPLEPDFLREARRVTGSLLGEYEAAQVRRMEERMGVLRRLELRQALVQEYWGWWLHENPGAGRAQRRRVWCAALALAFPGVAELGSPPDLEDTLFLETAFFLPDWSPPSLARLLLEAASSTDGLSTDYTDYTD